jgi:threonine/homoserine/homoserine lactone efflux protein
VIPWWAFLAVAVPLVLIPGASTTIVLRNSLSGGTRAGVHTALGANTSSVCLGLACAFGLAFALQQWPLVWFALRSVGIAYLAWLGARSLWHAVHPRQSTIGPPVRAASGRSDALQNFRDGFVTNASNPALATFYFVVLPQFVPRNVPIAPAVLQLTAIHVTLALSWHTVWAMVGGTIAHVLSDGWPRRLLDAAAGGALLIFAMRLFLGLRAA